MNDSGRERADAGQEKTSSARVPTHSRAFSSVAAWKVPLKTVCVPGVHWGLYGNLIPLVMEPSGSGGGGILKKAFAECIEPSELFAKIRKTNKRIEIDLAIFRAIGQWLQGKEPSVRLSMLADTKPFAGLFQPPASPVILTRKRFT